MVVAAGYDGYGSYMEYHPLGATVVDVGEEEQVGGGADLVHLGDEAAHLEEKEEEEEERGSALFSLSVLQSHEVVGGGGGGGGGGHQLTMSYFSSHRSRRWSSSMHACKQAKPYRTISTAIRTTLHNPPPSLNPCSPNLQSHLIQATRRRRRKAFTPCPTPPPSSKGLSLIVDPLFSAAILQTFGPSIDDALEFLYINARDMIMHGGQEGGKER